MTPTPSTYTVPETDLRRVRAMLGGANTAASEAARGTHAATDWIDELLASGADPGPDPPPADPVDPPPADPVDPTTPPVDPPPPAADAYVPPAPWRWLARPFGQYAEGYPFSAAARMVVEAVDPGETRGVAMALRRAAERVAQIPEAEREQHEVLILVPAGEHDGFGVGSGSPHGPDYVGEHIFDVSRVTIAGERPARMPVQGFPPDAAPQANHCLSIVTPGRSIPGGDTISIFKGRPGAELRLIGLEVRVAGRTAIIISTGDDFVLSATQTHLATEMRALNAEGSDLKWGCQLFLVADQWVQCSAHLFGIKEHVWYKHGSSRSLPQSAIVDTLVTACGGQVRQLTEREHEVPDRPAALEIIANCVFTGFGQNVSRASMAVTCAGAGVRMRILSCAIVDDNPHDTLGQSPNVEGTSYGALTTWTPPEDTQSYAEEDPTQGGYGNVELVIRDSIFAVREGNRQIATLTDCGEIDIAGSRFMTAGSTVGTPGKVSPRVNVAGHRQVGRFRYDGREQPSERVRQMADVAARGHLAEYAELAVRVESPSEQWIPADGVGEVVGVPPTQVP